MVEMIQCKAVCASCERSVLLRRGEDLEWMGMNGDAQARHTEVGHLKRS